MKLGNRKDAELIYRRRKSGAGPLPKGWKKLGEGAYRATYLSPDKIVYKICHDGQHIWNVEEFENYVKYRRTNPRLPSGWRVAPAKLHNITHQGEEVSIIAMKYVQGTHHKDIPDDWEAWCIEIGATGAFQACGIYDAHEGNFIVTPDGKNVIIDLGE